ERLGEGAPRLPQHAAPEPRPRAGHHQGRRLPAARPHPRAHERGSQGPQHVRARSRARPQPRKAPRGDGRIEMTATETRQRGTTPSTQTSTSTTTTTTTTTGRGKCLVAAIAFMAALGVPRPARADAGDTLLALSYVISVGAGALSTAVNGSYL